MRQDTKEGEHTLALSDTRQVTVSISSFTNKPSVDVREFYWAEGATGKELRPGKTGLFLNDLQWPSLVQHANALNDALLAGSEVRQPRKTAPSTLGRYSDSVRAGRVLSRLDLASFERTLAVSCVRREALRALELPVYGIDLLRAA